MLEALRQDWAVARLEDVARIFDCPHSTPELAPDGPFIARSQDIRGGIFRTDLAGHVSNETYRERIRRAEPQDGDLLFSREGTYFGIAAEVPPGIQVCLGQRMVLIRPHERLNSRFLRYWLNSPMLAEYAIGFHDGSVAQRLNVATIRRLPVPLPGLQEQQEVAATLGSLDDMIALNRRVRGTLETVGALMFQSWFQDFAPVSAKADRRRAIGVPDAINELMPNRFSVDATGTIPEGWTRVPVGDFVSISKDGVSPGEAPNELFDHYSIPAFDERLLPARERGEMILSNKYRVPANGVLVSKLNPQTPRVWWPAPRLNERSVCSTEFMPCVPRADVPREFLYELFRSSAFVEDIASLVTGTSNSHQRVKPGDFLRLHATLPTAGVMRGFAEIVGPVLAKSRHCLLENNTLGAIRESLLQELLKGTVRLRELEHAIAVTA